MKHRTTLNKIIAAQKTKGAKMNAALQNGQKPSAIKMLVYEAAILRAPVRNEKAWQDWHVGAVARLKAQFADLVFPLLMADNSAAFNEVADEMNLCRKFKGEFLYGKLNAKQAQGVMLRRALLALDYDDLLSIGTVLSALEAYQIEFDERHVRRVMEELGVNFLKPGIRYCSIVGGKIVREVSVKSGKLIEKGISRKQFNSILGRKRFGEIHSDK